jgi:hypothetical protein
VSWGQQDIRALAHIFSPGAAIGVEEWHVLGRATGFIPMAGPTDISIDVLASVSAGAQVDLVELAQVGGQSVLFDATDLLETHTLQVTPNAQGLVDFELRVRSMATRMMVVHSVVGTWQAAADADTAVALCGTKAAPVASIKLLMSAVSIVQDAALLLYAQAAHMCDSNTAGLEQRTFGVMVPPACRLARFALTRSGAGTALQASSTIKTTTSGGFASAAKVITVAGPQLGAESYLDMGATKAGVEIVLSADTSQPAPVATMDRSAELPEFTHPTVEHCEVNTCAGFGVIVWSRTADLEAL